MCVFMYEETDDGFNTKTRYRVKTLSPLCSFRDRDVNLGQNPRTRAREHMNCFPGSNEVIGDVTRSQAPSGSRPHSRFVPRPSPLPVMSVDFVKVGQQLAVAVCQRADSRHRDLLK